MYAVIATGGKQRRVQLGRRYQIERISTELDEKVVFEQVLLLNDDQKIHIGTPQVTGASVEAVVVDHARGPKIRIIKMRRRKHSMTKTGHRQQYTWVRITRIGSSSEPTPSQAEAVKTQAKQVDEGEANQTKTQDKPIKKPTRTTTRKTAQPVEKKPVAAQKKAKTSSKKSKEDTTETPS